MLEITLIHRKQKKYTVFQGALGPVRRVNVWWEGSTNVYVTSSIKFEYAKNQVAPNKKKRKRIREIKSQ